MNKEFIEKMAPPAGRKPRPTLKQLEYQRRFNRRNIEREIAELETQFKNCSFVEEPGRWLQLQTDLGYAYKKLMEMERK